MVGFDVITSSLKFSVRHDCQYKLSLLNRWFRKFPRGRWIINNEICASSKPFMLVPWPCWPGGRNARKNSSQTSLKIWGPFPTRYILVALCTCREKTSISFGRGSWWNHSSLRLMFCWFDATHQGPLTISNSTYDRIATWKLLLRESHSFSYIP